MQQVPFAPADDGGDARRGHGRRCPANLGQTRTDPLPPDSASFAFIPYFISSVLSDSGRLLTRIAFLFPDRDNTVSFLLDPALNLYAARMPGCFGPLPRFLHVN